MSGTSADPALGRIDLANRFQTTLRALVHAPEAHAEAIAILAFYRALHLVDALFLSTKGRAPSTHSDRGQSLGRGQRFRELKKQYDPLFEAA